MATVNSATTTSAADTFAALNGTAKKTATSNAAEAESKFLTLLMAQMKNQDPLNPLDNAQVTSQLAQLNTVSGIEKLNSTVGQILSGYNDSQAMQAAGMIGKNVMVAGNALPLASGQAIGGALLDGSAEQVTLTIKDAAGRVVQTENLGAKPTGSFYFAWDGKDAAGNVQKDGNYTFAVDANSGSNKVPASAMQIGTVSAVVRSKDGFLLDLGALGDVAFKDVQQIL